MKHRPLGIYDIYIHIYRNCYRRRGGEKIHICRKGAPVRVCMGSLQSSPWSLRAVVACDTSLYCYEPFSRSTAVSSLSIQRTVYYKQFSLRMAEVNFGFDGRKNDGSKGIERRTNGTIFYKMNKSCDSCNVAKRKCDNKLPCRYDASRVLGTRKLYY